MSPEWQNIRNVFWILTGPFKMNMMHVSHIFSSLMNIFKSIYNWSFPVIKAKRKYRNQLSWLSTGLKESIERKKKQVIFEDIFTVQTLQCSKQRLWGRPGVNTENNPYSPFLQNEKRFYIWFICKSPTLITIYHVRIYERVRQTLQRFTVEYFSSLDFTTQYFSSLDYSLDTTTTFLYINDIWSFQLNLLSIITPRNFD